SAVTHALQTNGHVITIPLSSGEIYRLSKPIIWNKSNLSVYGDGAIARAGKNIGGHIRGPIDEPVFDIQSPSTGHFHFEKLHFVGGNSKRKGKCAIRNFANNNGPDRGWTFRHLTASGYIDAIRLDNQ